MNGGRPPILFFLVAIVFCVAASAQPDKTVKKDLEASLFRKTPYVRSARLNGCRLTLNVDASSSTGFNPLAGTMPGAMPTEGEIYAAGSAGSGSRNLIRLDVELSLFDAGEIVLATTNRKEHSMLMLTGRSSDAVLRVWNGKRDRSNSLDLRVYSKDAAAVAATVRAAVTACKPKKNPT